MPWCEPCGRFYNPNTLTPEGRCPADHAVGDSRAANRDRPGSADEPGRERGAPGRGPADRGPGTEAPAASGRVDVAGDEPPTKVPWHFWLLVVALVLYLGWRLVQAVAWIVG